MRIETPEDIARCRKGKAELDRLKTPYPDMPEGRDLLVELSKIFGEKLQMWMPSASREECWEADEERALNQDGTPYLDKYLRIKICRSPLFMKETPKTSYFDYYDTDSRVPKKEI